ncbi:MAG: molybdopterin molybdotransferase MoeA [Chitinophagales bacterium]
MISIQQATQIVLDHICNIGTETVPLVQSLGRVLQEDLKADRDFPPFPRITMDGIAIQYQTFAAGKRTFSIEDLQAAGMAQKTLQNSDNCLEVMTGAILPKNTDTVIRYEDVEIVNGKATILLEEINDSQNVHQQGLDRQKGGLIVPKGRVISSAEIAVASTIGKTHLEISRLPKVVIVSTGDELVDVAETPLPHQIRKSNVYSLQTTLLQWGIAAETRHLPDDKAHIHQELSEYLQDFEVIILSGGVSKGKLDFVPEVLEELQVEKLFHQVAQRPGKPFWFGKTANSRVHIFALPGNPVSTFMCAHRYFQPWLRKSLGLPPFQKEFAILQSDFHFRPALTYFLQVKLKNGEDGKLWAIPVEGQGSGDLANLVDADGFLELPSDRNDFAAGEVFGLMRYRNGSEN